MHENETPEALRFPSLRRSSDRDDPRRVRDVAHVKRFLERWSMDDRFRERFDDDSRAALGELGLAIGLDDVVPFLGDWGARQSPWWQSVDEETVTPAARHYLDFQRELIGHHRAARAKAVPPTRRQAGWRQRQIHRTAAEIGPRKADSVVHAPIAFELARGCTVGCWFCGVAAERFAGWFEYTPDHALLWRGVLEATRRVYGEAAGCGFCYWATDPLDNPDYERFLLDFHHRLGRWPQTTTAIPHRDLERTRRLLRLAREHGSRLNRFSILSTAILRRIHEAFSAEELLHVELVPQNKGALPYFKKARAGRALQSPDRRRDEIVPGIASTIACVSGFLVNMLERRVRLITPCNASERWPLGYWVFDEGFFETPGEYEERLVSMVERHMSCDLDLSRPLRLRPDVEVARDGERMVVATAALKVTWPPTPGNDLVLERLRDGSPSATQLALDLERAAGRPLHETLALVTELYDRGLLWEEPAAAEPGSRVGAGPA